MARPDHYVPAIDRFLVKVIHHEAKNRGIPMTRLVGSLLRDALLGTAAWRMAEAETAVETAGPQCNHTGTPAPVNGSGFRYEIPREDEASREAA